MVDVKQTNEKLHARARNIVVEACDCTPEVASTALEEAGGSVKLAVTSILLNLPASQAAEALEASGGHVRRALEERGSC